MVEGQVKTFRTGMRLLECCKICEETKFIDKTSQRPDTAPNSPKLECSYCHTVYKSKYISETREREWSVFPSEIAKDVYSERV